MCQEVSLLAPWSHIVLVGVHTDNVVDVSGGRACIFVGV